MLINKFLPELLRNPEGDASGVAPASASESEGSSSPGSAPKVGDTLGGLQDATGEDEVNGFEDYSDLLGGEDNTASTPPADASHAGAPAAASPPPQTTQVPPQGGQQAPPAAGDAPQQQSGQPAAEAASAAAAEPAKAPPASFLEALANVQDKVVPELAKLYTLPQEGEKSFAPEQGAALRHMAGMLHFNVLRAAAAMIENLVPNMIVRHQESTRSENEAQEAFFRQWPQLTREHIPVISKYGTMWAQANPNGKLEDYIKQVGTMAAAELGLLQAAAAVQKAAAPAGGARSVPFVPANVTGVRTAPVPGAPQQKQTQDWADLADLMGQDM